MAFPSIGINRENGKMGKRLRQELSARSPSTLLYWIEDRHRLGSLLELHVVAPARGQAAAAKKLGVSPSLLSKLINHRLTSIRASTLHAIERELAPGAREQLLDAVQSPEIRSALRRYDDWLESTLSDFRRGRSGARWSITSTADLLALLEAHNAYRDYFADFGEAVRRKWGDSAETERRIELSKHRVLVPLVQVIPSGGIERPAVEMHASGDLGPYLNAALTAERRLLNRKPALERLRAVRASSTVSVEG